MKFLTYCSSKQVKVVFPHNRVLQYGVQNTREERKGIDLGTKENPEEGTLIYLTLAHA